jgi:hypothetical protein
MNDTASLPADNDLDGSETDLNPSPDRMITDSSDSSYSPSMAASTSSGDDLSADASNNISFLYADQQLPPQPIHPDPFDLMDFKVGLSQQAFLHFQQLDDHVTTTMPNRHDKFHHLLSHAVRTHQDPVNLETTVKNWSENQP